jgi:ligand-binding sensor domain-containing protein
MIQIFLKWLGLACFLFLFLLSVSGIILINADSLDLNKKVIEGKFIPDKYYQIAETHRSIQSLASITLGNKVLIYVGTDHGLYRSINSGKSWIQLKQGLFSQDIRALAIDPKNSQLMYAGTPKGIFKSEDQGESWNKWFDKAHGLTNVFINDLLIDPNKTKVIYAATQSGLFVSSEREDLWRPVKDKVLKNKNIQTIQFSAAKPSQLIISTKNSVYRNSVDGDIVEKKWTDIPKEISSIITLKTDPEFIFIGTGKGFYKSFNGGLNWIKDKNKYLKNITTLAIDKQDNASIFLGSDKGLFYTKNSGDIWRDITPNKYNLTSEKFEKHLNSMSQREFQRYKLGIGPIKKILTAPISSSINSLLLIASETDLFISKNNGTLWDIIDLGSATHALEQDHFKMKLSKLIIEIHTGRFFGAYFYWLVNISSIAMIGLAFYGLIKLFPTSK